MIADFSMSKIINRGKKGSKIGTPEYMAPELVIQKWQHKGYTGMEADNYSLGVILYQMLYGYCPFQKRGKTDNNFWKRIATDKVEFDEQKTISEEAKDLMLKLLEKDPKIRLGSGRKGCREIRYHKWFRFVPWAKYFDFAKWKPYYKPSVIRLRKQKTMDNEWGMEIKKR